MKKSNFLGTTRDMVIDCIEVNGRLKAIAIDARGLYITSPDQIGKPATDENRGRAERHHDIRQLARLGIDTRALFEQNRHRISTDRC